MIRVFKNAFAIAHSIFPQGGTCLEFGVYTGGTFAWQAERVRKDHQSSHLVGFDSWQGLPSETEGEWAPERHSQGRYASTKDVVLARLSSVGMKDDPRVELVDGFFNESLTEKLKKKLKERSDLIFVNIDVDIYSSTIELLDFVKPLLRPGVILYWDDWKDPRLLHEGDWGEHKAWKDWSLRNSDVLAEDLEVNPLNQRSMIITRVGEMQLQHEKLAKIRYDAFEIVNGNPSAVVRIKRQIKKMLSRR